MIVANLVVPWYIYFILLQLASVQVDQLGPFDPRTSRTSAMETPPTAMSDRFPMLDVWEPGFLPGKTGENPWGQGRYRLKL